MEPDVAVIARDLVIHFVKNMDWPRSSEMGAIPETLRHAEMAASDQLLQASDSLQPLLLQFARTHSTSFVDGVAESLRSGRIAERHQPALAKILIDNGMLAPRGLAEAEDELRSRMPRTPEQVEDVGQAAVEVMTDPERRALVDRVTTSVKGIDVSGLTPWALLVMVAWLLAWFSGKPGTEVSNDIGSLAIIVAVAAIIQARK